MTTLCIKLYDFVSKCRFRIAGHETKDENPLKTFQVTYFRVRPRGCPSAELNALWCACLYKLDITKRLVVRSGMDA